MNEFVRLGNAILRIADIKIISAVNFRDGIYCDVEIILNDSTRIFEERILEDDFYNFRGILNAASKEVK